MSSEKFRHLLLFRFLNLIKIDSYIVCTTHVTFI